MEKVIAQIKVIVDPRVVRRRVNEALKIKKMDTSTLAELAKRAGFSKADLDLALSYFMDEEAEKKRERLAYEVQVFADAFGVEAITLIL